MSDDTKYSCDKKQMRQRSLEQIKEEHLKVVQNQVEEAKNPISYETYDYAVSLADERVKLFTARRRGISHINGETPCQDYCLTDSAYGCTILADADGVSSCEHSDIGSKLACEAVVLAVKEETKSEIEEEQLVNRLVSTSFRDKLVSIWCNSVMDEVKKKEELSDFDTLKEFSKYGSTIMFAVMTQNWIVVGNLGDGQILVFNDYYGVKIRVHAPKDSSSVRCLANERCVREDFVVGKYPRTCFNGVLLSTDGIYESFDKGVLFFDYCTQIKKRFLEKNPNEPYQAFCYLEKGEPYKDFSRMRTQDDCSIALGFDERNLDSGYDKIMTSLLQHTQAAFLKRWSPECMSFYIKQDDYYADVIVSPKDDNIILPEKLETAILENPNRTWEEEGYCLNEYIDVTEPTMEFMRCSGMLRRDKSNPRESEQKILEIYLSILKLRRELQELGLGFNSSVLFNMSFDGQLLHIRKDALKSGPNDYSICSYDDLEMCFEHLLGVIESGGEKIPIFDIGYIKRGIKYYRIGHSEDGLAQLIRNKKGLYLKNISGYSWECEDGVILPSGEYRELGKKMGFTLIDEQGEKIEEYKYVSKELL